MTRGRLILLGLLVLFSPLSKSVPGKTASTDGAGDRQAVSAAQIADFHGRYPAATQCRSCHAEQFKDWSGSFHAQSLTTEGFLRTLPQYLEFLGSQADDPQAPMACFNCHAPLLKDADRAVIRQVTDFVRNKETSRLQGFEVGCVACHLDKNRGFAGPIGKSADNPFHASNFSPSYKAASFCSSCHMSQASSVSCSDVYSDWTKSEAAGQGKTCQSCHMPEQSGLAGAGGALRTVGSHALAGGRSPAMLQQALTLGLQAAFQKDQLEVRVTIRNLVPHRVPDG